MGLFDGLTSGTLGSAIALQGQPNTYANIAQENVQYERQKREKEAKVIADKQKEIEEKWGKFNITGSPTGVPAIDTLSLNTVKEAVGKLHELRVKGIDPTISSDAQQIMQDAQYKLAGYKQQAENLQKDMATHLQKDSGYNFNQDILKASSNSDSTDFLHATGGIYTPGQGLQKIFDAYTPLKQINVPEFENKTENGDITIKTAGADLKKLDTSIDDFFKTPQGKNYLNEGIQNQSFTNKEDAKKFVVGVVAPKVKNVYERTLDEEKLGAKNKNNISVTEDVRPDGTRVVNFSKTNDTENKELDFVIPDPLSKDYKNSEIIKGVPIRFEQKLGEAAHLIVAVTKKEAVPGDITGTKFTTITSYRNVPYDVASPKIENEYGFNFQDIKQGVKLPSNIKVSRYTEKSNNTEQKIEQEKTIGNNSYVKIGGKWYAK